MKAGNAPRMARGFAHLTAREGEHHDELRQGDHSMQSRGRLRTDWRRETTSSSQELYLQISGARSWRQSMSTRFGIAALVYLMLQAMLFGVGAVLVLATPLKEVAMQLLPWVVGVSVVVAAPLSWWLAPRLRARYWHRGRKNAADRMLSSIS